MYSMIHFFSLLQLVCASRAVYPSEARLSPPPVSVMYANSPPPLPFMSIVPGCRSSDKCCAKVFDNWVYLVRKWYQKRDREISWFRRSKYIWRTLPIGSRAAIMLSRTTARFDCTDVRDDVLYTFEPRSRTVEYLNIGSWVLECPLGFKAKLYQSIPGFVVDDQVSGATKATCVWDSILPLIGIKIGRTVCTDSVTIPQNARNLIASTTTEENLAHMSLGAVGCSVRATEEERSFQTSADKVTELTLDRPVAGCEYRTCAHVNWAPDVDMKRVLGGLFITYSLVMSLPGKIH